MTDNPDSLSAERANAEAAANEEIVRLRAERDRAIAALTDTCAALAQARKDFKIAFAVTKQPVIAMENSIFWKASGPLRRLSSRLPASLRTNFTRAVRLIWWAVSLQLPRRLRERATTISKVARIDFLSSPAACALVSARLPLSQRNIDRPMVVIIDEKWPEPDHDGSAFDMVRLIKAMQVLGFDVIFTATLHDASTSHQRDAIAGLGVRCLGPYDSLSIEAFIEAHGRTVSIYVLNGLAVGGQFLELIHYKWPEAKIVFNTGHLHFPREEREARLSGDQQRMLTAANTRDLEEFLVHRSDATIAVSAVERSLLMGAVPGRYIIDLQPAPGEQASRSVLAEQCDIASIGSQSPRPNVDEVRENLVGAYTVRLQEMLIALGVL